MAHPLLAALLAVGLTGCLAAQATPQEPADIRRWNTPRPHESDASAQDDATRPDEPLRVSWFPEMPKPGDMVRVTIEAPHRWPPPRCAVHGHAADLSGGGGTSSAPAAETSDGYECHVPVSNSDVAIVLLVTRPDDELLRIHGPHVIEVRSDGMPLREAFESFEMEATRGGLPRITGEVPAALANVGAPQVGPSFGWTTTHADLSFQVFPTGHRLTAGYGEWVQWATPFAFENVVDVPAFLRGSERHFGEDYRENDYVLIAHAFARGDIAFATSESRIMGFGACAVQMCYVVDG